MTDFTRWMASTNRVFRQRESGGSAVLRRRYEESIDEVWSACTDGDRLRRWFGDVSGELRLGETVIVEIGQPETLACRILRCEQPRLLTVTWAYGTMTPDEVELRLKEDGNGTMLELEHRSSHTEIWSTGVGPGWEDWLFRLSTALEGGDGRAVSSEEIQSLVEPLWAAVEVSRHTDALDR